MSQFASEKKLISIRVDKALLLRIEEYARSELVSLSGIPAEEIPEVFSITITDSVGTEVLRSIAEHRPAQLPDSVQRVAVSFDSRYSRAPQRKAGIYVNISFSRERLFSAFSVTCIAEAARDTVVGINDAVLRILEPHWTDNHFFHPSSGSSVLLGLTIWTSGTLSISLFASGSISAASWLLLVAGCIGAYAFAGRFLKPWTTFDTRVDRRNEELWLLLRNGMVGFILFGSVFTLVRRRLLGF